MPAVQLHRKLLDKARRLLAGLELRSESVWPGLWNDLFVAHASVYHFFSRFAPGKSILDAGCGVGYGADILARAGARAVVGVDRSSASIRFARRRYGSSTVDFQVGDLQALSFPASRFDLIVSSNTLEHLAEPLSFLRPMAGWLAAGGGAIVAVPPITNELQRRQNQANRFHLSNLSVRQWHDLLASLGWAVQCFRHDLEDGLEKLDFSAFTPTEVEPEDFRFEPCSLDELYSRPTLGALFRLSRRAVDPPPPDQRPGSGDRPGSGPPGAIER